MSVDLTLIQARRDRELRSKLSEDEGVKRALARLEQRSSGWGFGARRRLLTGALRLTRNIAPEVADALKSCRDAIGFERDVEIYVRPEPMFNAFCMKNPSGPVIIALSSRLLEVFTPPELQFVIGHELGHATFDHFGIPMPHTAAIEDMAGPIVGRQTALQLYVWCRAAELTADRTGLVCTQDPEAAARSFFKLASGMASPRVRADLEEYASQVDSLATAPEARAEPRTDDDTLDCFSTHPYSPVRVRALVAYSKSKLYQKALGEDPTGIEADDLEAIIDRDLKLMEPTYLEEKTSDSQLLRKILFNAGMLVAAANHEIVEQEVKSLRTLLGADLVDEGVVERFDRDKTNEKLSEQAKKAVDDIPLADRARVIQHLTIIAAADGTVDSDELGEMSRIADLLQVNPTVIDQTLAAAAEPMD